MGIEKFFYTPIADRARYTRLAHDAIKRGIAPTHLILPWRGAAAIQESFNGELESYSLKKAEPWFALLSAYDNFDRRRKKIEFLGKQQLRKRLGASLDAYALEHGKSPIIGICEDMIDSSGSLHTLLPFLAEAFPGVRRYVLVGQVKDNGIPNRIEPNLAVEHVPWWSVYAHELYPHRFDALREGKPWALDALSGSPATVDDPHWQSLLDGFALGHVMHADGFKPSHTFTLWPESSAGIAASEALAYRKKMFDGLKFGTRPWPVEVLPSGEVIGIEHAHLPPGSQAGIISRAHNPDTTQAIVDALTAKYGTLDIRTAALRSYGRDPNYLPPERVGRIAIGDADAPGVLIHDA